MDNTKIAWPENKRFIALADVMKTVDQWLNSDDVYITNGPGGEKLPDAWIDCVKGSLLFRMAKVIAALPATPTIPLPADSGWMVQELKELDASFDYLCKMDGVKDAGHRWIEFTDKWNAFKKRLSGQLPVQK